MGRGWQRRDGQLLEGLPPLYGWQADALGAWRGQGRRGIVEAVTGTGKSRLGIEAIADALVSGQRAAVLVPTQELQEQWATTLGGHLPKSVRIGRLGGGGQDTLRSRDVVVSIVNSARHGGLRAPDGALLVADECHRYASPENRTALVDEFATRLGLTATLERPDRLDRHLTDYLGAACFTMGYAQAIAEEVTAHFMVGLVGVPMSDDEASEYDRFSKRIGDLATTLIQRHRFPSKPFHQFLRAVNQAAETRGHPAERIAQQLLNTMYARRHLLATSTSKIAAAAALAPAIKSAGGTLVFTDSIDTSEAVGAILKSQGVAIETIHSEHSREHRRSALRRFGAGRIDAVVAPKVLDEGIDVPEADLAVIVAGSSTRRQMVQRLGRVLRRKRDGRLARLAVLFLEGTVEDPACGAHAVFLGEVLAVADEYKVFSREHIVEANAFLNAFAANTPQAPARRMGEPAARTAEPPADDAVPTASVLGFGPSVKSSISSAAPARSRSPRLADALSVLTRDVDRAKTEIVRTHAFITGQEHRELVEALPRLIQSYGIEAVLDGIRRSPSLRVVEARAKQRSAGVDPTRKPRKPGRPPSNQGSGGATVEQRPRPAGSRKSTRITQLDHPRYKGGRAERCPSCGGPVTSCAC